jgi:hypothetical protein
MRSIQVLERLIAKANAKVATALSSIQHPSVEFAGRQYKVLKKKKKIRVYKRAPQINDTGSDQKNV